MNIFGEITGGFYPHTGDRESGCGQARPLRRAFVQSSRDRKRKMNRKVFLCYLAMCRK